MTLDPIVDRTALRLQLLRNGYAPLPNVDKVCRLPNWPRVGVNENFINSYKRAEAWQATGLRIERGLTAIDADVPIDGLAKRIGKGVPGLLRIGKPPKWMRLVRCADADVAVLRSHRWTDGESTARIEIFLGGVKQVGAFGWHTKGERLYQWPGKSPLDVPLDRLPVMPQRALAQLCDRFNVLAQAFGLVKLEPPKALTGAHVFDLDEDSRFKDSDGRVEVTLAQLEANYLAARHGGRAYAVSSSYRGDDGRRKDKASVIWSTVFDCIAVYDFEQYVLHLPKALASAHGGGAMEEQFEIVGGAFSIDDAVEIFEERNDAQPTPTRPQRARKP